MEAPELDRFYREQSGKAGVLAVAVGDTPGAMRQFMESGGWTFPVVLDGDQVGLAYGVQYIPALFVLDKYGRIAEVPEGLVSASQLAELVDGLDD